MKRRFLSLPNPVPQGISVDSVVVQICDNCRFYDAQQYECRKRTPLRRPETGNGCWPKVDPEDWCGEFKRLPFKGD